MGHFKVCLKNAFFQNFVDLDHSFDVNIYKNIKKLQLAPKLTNLHKEIYEISRKMHFPLKKVPL
jgi:hypothetical protein